MSLHRTCQWLGLAASSLGILLLVFLAQMKAPNIRLFAESNRGGSTVCIEGTALIDTESTGKYLIGSPCPIRTGLSYIYPGLHAGSFRLERGYQPKTIEIRKRYLVRFAILLAVGGLAIIFLNGRTSRRLLPQVN
jgi:hypothetical protein